LPDFLFLVGQVAFTDISIPVIPYKLFQSCQLQYLTLRSETFAWADLNSK